MSPGWDCEHIVQLFKGPLFRLGNKEEDEHQGGDVETGVETKGSHSGESNEDSREGDGEDSSPEKTGCHGPGHTNLTMREGEDFGRVGEGHGTLAGRVKGGEEKDEEGDQAEMGVVFFRDQEAKTGCQERPGHIGKGEQKQGTTSPGVNGPDGGPSEDEVDQSEPERRQQSLQIASTRLTENGGGVEGDDVDTAHLLGQHDGK